MWESLLKALKRVWRKEAPQAGAAGTLTLHDNLQYKLKRGGKGKPVVEGFTGDDLYRKTGRWMHKVQIVDREQDRYFKEIVDPATGEVVRRCEEPLSEHRGHGTAKKR